MKLSCKEAGRLISEGLDRKLSLRNAPRCGFTSRSATPATRIQFAVPILAPRGIALPGPDRDGGES